MLMTYTSPELPTAAESVEQTGRPVASRRLKPDGESGDEKQKNHHNRASDESDEDE